MSMLETLIDVTGLDDVSNDQEVLVKVIDAINDLEDADYEDLPADIKKWADKAIDAVNDDTDIPSIPGIEETAEEEPAPKAKAKRKAKAKPEAAPEKAPEEAGNEGTSLEIDSLEKGNKVLIEDKFGEKISGAVSKITASFVILDIGDGEKRVSKKRIISISALEDGLEEEPEEEAAKAVAKPKATTKKTKALEKAAPVSVETEVVTPLKFSNEELEAVATTALRNAEAAVLALKLILNQIKS